MENVKNLTVREYIFAVDLWFQQTRERPINQWSIFEKAKRWRF